MVQALEIEDIEQVACQLLEEKWILDTESW